MADPFEADITSSSARADSAKPESASEPPPRGGDHTIDWVAFQYCRGAGLYSVGGRAHFWFLEKHDNFVRFYAMQSIIFGGAWVVFNIISRIVFEILAPSRRWAVCWFSSGPSFKRSFISLFSSSW